MKESRLKNWTKDEKFDCLLFFALRLRELVFDYTLDSFKYPALNSYTICKEALNLINEVENENFSVKSLEPVIEELVYKLKNDKVVKKILATDLEYYINFGDYTNIKENKVKIEILTNKLNPVKYLKVVTENLKDLVIENKQKRTIYELTTLYISSLINIGFSQSYIYLQINNTFFSNQPIDSFDVIQNFFDIFKLELKSYKCIFKVSDIFDEVKSSSNAFNMTITNELSDELKELDKGNYLISKNKNERYLIIENINKLDAVSAKHKGVELINNLSKLFVFFHHKTHPTWSNSALIVDEEKNSFLIKEKISAMSKSTDHKPKKAAIKLNLLIKGLSLERTSFYKYDRVIDLHGLSVQNKIIENQLLQNWIAFETLLVGYNKDSKIDQVINNLLPFLMSRYVFVQISELLRDLNRYDIQYVRSKIKSIPIGDSLIEKFTALIILDDLKTERHELYNRLQYNPLLKFRISEFHAAFSKIENLEKHIQNHRIKVIWQIKRMYRARNLIVHAGTVPNFTESLVENSHTYLDKVINTINYLCIKENSITSIEQAIKEVQICVSKQSRFIKDTKEIDKTNFTNVLL